MGNRRHMPEGMKLAMLEMASQNHTTSMIASSLQISRKTMYRTFKKAEQTGSVVTHPIPYGRPRTLSGIQAAVCKQCHRFLLPTDSMQFLQVCIELTQSERN
jgi:transposase